MRKIGILERFARQDEDGRDQGAVGECGHAVRWHVLWHRYASHPVGGRCGAARVDLEHFNRFTTAMVRGVNGVAPALRRPEAQAMQDRQLGVERLFRDARAGWVMAPTVDHLADFIGRALTGLPLL